MATSSEGQLVTVSDLQVSGLVTGWSKGSEGQVYLLMGDAALPLKDVLAVKEPSNQESKSQEASLLEDILKALGTISGLAALL